MVKEMTCTVCPVGCRMEVEIDINGNITSINGNICKRGDKYATDEIINPVRTLTSTVLIYGSEYDKLMPVRTDKPIPKDKMAQAMKLIKAVTVTAPVKSGAVIVGDFIENGTNLISCKDIQ